MYFKKIVKLKICSKNSIAFNSLRNTVSTKAKKLHVFILVLSKTVLCDSGLVPLHNACSYGHYEVAELLVLHGAVVNVADLWKFTPLHEAAAKGKYEICKLLLQVSEISD